MFLRIYPTTMSPIYSDTKLLLNNLVTFECKYFIIYKFNFSKTCQADSVYSELSNKLKFIEIKLLDPEKFVINRKQLF